MNGPVPSPRKRFWRLFDRWALGVVMCLQAAILAMRWSGRQGPDGRDARPSVDAARSVEALSPGRLPRAVAASPVSFGGGPHRTPASVESTGIGTSWEVLCGSPALDIRETTDRFELRLSLPPPNGRDARAYVVGRRLDIEVPLRDAAGHPAGRLFRQVLLPAEPCPDSPPHLEHTNGILRVFLDKQAPAG